MTTIIFVRHAQSPFVHGKERTRGLSAQGEIATHKVKDVLKNEHIDFMFSSPYERAIQTIRPLAIERRKEIVLEEDLRERKLVGDGYELTNDEFMEMKQKVYEDWDYSLPGGETSKQAQERAVKALLGIMKKYRGTNIVIGTHGDIMTLMLNYFNPKYHYDFWRKTTMPDIYELGFDGVELKQVNRRWQYREGE